MNKNQHSVLYVTTQVLPDHLHIEYTSDYRWEQIQIVEIERWVLEFWIYFELKDLQILTHDV